jgi:hypothetical protein
VASWKRISRLAVSRKDAVDGEHVYLLIAQAEPTVEGYRRQGDRQWVITKAPALEATIELPSIGAVLALRDVYDGAL